MRKAVAITHVAFEDLGSLETELTRAGYAIELVDACTSDLRAIAHSKPDLLVVLGGPIGVYDNRDYPFLNPELELIRSRLAGKRPTIGVCLGAQLIAAAAGASVYPGAQGKEIGWSPLHGGSDAALFPEFAAFLAAGQPVLHWHGDTFDLPSGSRHLAASGVYPNQAFAIERHALGLQFHLEVTARGLERWYVGHTCELGKAGISVPQLRHDGEVFAPALEDVARLFWNEWLARL